MSYNSPPDFISLSLRPSLNLFLSYKPPTLLDSPSSLSLPLSLSQALTVCLRNPLGKNISQLSCSTYSRTDARALSKIKQSKQSKRNISVKTIGHCKSEEIRYFGTPNHHCDGKYYTLHPIHCLLNRLSQRHCVSLSILLVYLQFLSCFQSL